MHEAVSRRSLLHPYGLWGMAAGGSEPRTQAVYRGAATDAAESASFPSQEEQAPVRLRVVSLNVWALPLKSKDTPARLTAIVRRLAELDVDIVGLQEVWLGEARQRLLAEAREVSELQHHYSFRSGIRESGLLILSRFPIRAAGFHRFRLSGRPERLADAEYYAGKGIGYVRLQTPAGEVDVYNTHLIAQYTTDEQDPYRAHRTTAAYEMVNFVATHSGKGNPVLLLGDLNLRPDQLGYQIVTCIGGFRDAYLVPNPEQGGQTRSGSNPYTPGEEPKRIDYIFTKDGAALGLHTVASRVIMDEPPPLVDGSAPPAYSDHYGVLGEIELVAGRPPEKAAQGGCDPASAIWTEFLAYLDAALWEARSRKTGHVVKGAGGAVAAPTLYILGRSLKVPTAAVRTPMVERPVASTEEALDEGGERLDRSGPRHRLPLHRRSFLARLVKAIAVVGITPYALLHGWLGLSIVRDEIEELELIREEVLRQMGIGDGKR